MIGGAIFNLANLLLVAAIDMAGLAIAFPVSIGIALVVGVISSYATPTQGQRRAPGSRRRLRAHRRCPGRQSLWQPRHRRPHGLEEEHHCLRRVRRADGPLGSFCRARHDHTATLSAPTASPFSSPWARCSRV